MSKINEYFQQKEFIAHVKSCLDTFRLEPEIKSKYIGNRDIQITIHISNINDVDEVGRGLANLFWNAMHVFRKEIAEKAKEMVTKQLEEARLAAQVEVKEILADSEELKGD